MTTDRERLEKAKKTLNIDEFPSPEEHVEFLKDEMEILTGCRDLEKANRRMERVYQWRDENDAWDF